MLSNQICSSMTCSGPQCCGVADVPPAWGSGSVGSSRHRVTSSNGAVTRYASGGNILLNYRVILKYDRNPLRPTDLRQSNLKEAAAQVKCVDESDMCRLNPRMALWKMQPWRAICLKDAERSTCASMPEQEIYKGLGVSGLVTLARAMAFQGLCLGLASFSICWLSLGLAPDF